MGKCHHSFCFIFLSQDWLFESGIIHEFLSAGENKMLHIMILKLIQMEENMFAFCVHDHKKKIIVSGFILSNINCAACCGTIFGYITIMWSKKTSYKECYLY